jgi:hypothetical protein
MYALLHHKLADPEFFTAEIAESAEKKPESG